jgi:hypothetical protein
MSERRQVPRFPMSGPAKIIVAEGQPAIDCTVCEIAASGASLEVAAEVQLPETFFVLPDDGDASAYRCRLVWRDDTRVGIRFD